MAYKYFGPLWDFPGGNSGAGNNGSLMEVSMVFTVRHSLYKEELVMLMSKSEVGCERHRKTVLSMYHV